VHPGISRAAAAHGEQSEPIGEVAAGSHEEQVSASQIHAQAEIEA